MISDALKAGILLILVVFTIGVQKGRRIGYSRMWTWLVMSIVLGLSTSSWILSSVGPFDIYSYLDLGLTLSAGIFSLVVTLQLYVSGKVESVWMRKITEDLRQIL